MARYKFRVGKTYAGRVHGVHERPIENSSRSGIHLLRLDVEVFEILEHQQVLSSTGKHACRDIVVGPMVDPTRDDSLAAYAEALQLPVQAKLSTWLALNDQSRWVKIVFGAIRREDQSRRNPFEKIHPFALGKMVVREYDYRHDEEWVRISVAADDMEWDCSVPTARRRIDALALIWESELLIRTAGGQRLVNLPLLRHIWD